MSFVRFRQALAVMNLSEKEVTWYPKWVEGYAGFHGVRPAWEQETGELPLDRELLIAYLRSLRDSGVPAWRRHQAARALEIYQATVLRNSVVDFRPIRGKLQEIARAEERVGGVATGTATTVEGEGNPGFIDAIEPAAIQRMRERMRVPASSAQYRASVRWMGRPVYPASR